MDGVAESTLRVQVKGIYQNAAIVYLVVPGVKMLMQGFRPANNDGCYVFHEDDGRLLLPQGQPAFILCMGEEKGQTFWGKVQWTIGLTQEVAVQPAPMSKDAINTVIAQLHIEDLRLTVKDASNAAEIRAIDKEMSTADSLLKAIGGLKPQFCDCDCRLSDSSVHSEQVTVKSPVK